MEEFLKDLETLAVNIGGEWKDNVLIENNTGNDLIDAYNEGVQAMASQACYFVSAVLGKYAAKVGVQ